jgi:hypothetical protein
MSDFLGFCIGWAIGEIVPSIELNQSDKQLDQKPFQWKLVLFILGMPIILILLIIIVNN